MVSVYSMAIANRSVYRTYDDRFYPEIHLAKCIYVQSTNVNDIYKMDHFYGPYLCDGCYDMSLKAISIKNLAIIYCGEQAYRINFAFMSKNDAFNLLKNAVTIDRKGTL